MYLSVRVRYPNGLYKCVLVVEALVVNIIRFPLLFRGVARTFPKFVLMLWASLINNKKRIE